MTDALGPLECLLGHACALLVVTEDPGDKFDFGEIQGWKSVLKQQLTHRFVTGNHLEIFTGTHLDLLVSHTDYFLKGVPKKKYDSRTILEEKTDLGDNRFQIAEKNIPEYVE